MHLHGVLTTHADKLDPRLKPMIHWTGLQTRARLGGAVATRAIPLELTVSELQVNLCEWRKFVGIDAGLAAQTGRVIDAE